MFILGGFVASPLHSLPGRTLESPMRKDMSGTQAMSTMKKLQSVHKQRDH